MSIDDSKWGYFLYYPSYSTHQGHQGRGDGDGIIELFQWLPLFLSEKSTLISSIIANDPGQKWGYSISQLSNVVHKTQLSFNYGTYWSIFQLSLEYINKQLEVIQIAVFVTSDNLAWDVQNGTSTKPCLFLVTCLPGHAQKSSRLSSVSLAKNMRLRKKRTATWVSQDFKTRLPFHFPSGNLIRQ